MNSPARCPSCQFGPIELPVCSKCGFKFDVVEGITDLRTDKTFDTLLDTTSYDDHHGVHDTVSPSVFKVYADLIEHCGLSAGGKALEIACGSGKLTASMLAADCFETVHCGDISFDFMKRMAARVSNIPTNTEIQKYLFDANRLPFEDDSFDFVFGNSVLHHFAEFERTIEDAFRVLKPGGAALFGEPLFDSHAMIALAAGLIVRSPDATEENGMSRKHIEALKTIQSRLNKKLDALHGDRTSLRDTEDKFFFPVRMLRDLGSQIGYSRVVISPVEANYKLGDLVKVKIYRILERINLTTEPLSSFEYIFDALTHDFGQPMHKFMYPIFGQIAFVR